MSYFFDVVAITGHRTPRTGRAAERASHTLFRALEARNAIAEQDIGVGSAGPAPRTPRTQRRTSARKPAGEDDDGDSEPARHSISATAHEGFVIQTADGTTARLCVVSEDGEVLSDDVGREAFKVAVVAYRQFLQGTGHLKIHAGPPSGLKT